MIYSRAKGLERSVINSSKSFSRWWLAALAALVAGSLMLLAMAPAPFIWIFVLWGTVICLFGYVHRHETIGVLIFNLGFLFLGVAAIEAFLEIAARARPASGYVKTYAIRYHTPHPYLGTRPRANVVETGAAHRKDELLYEVEYTIGVNGLRLAPPDKGSNIIGCVLFFGGSFVYGEGVEDDQTLPYLTGMRTEGNYRVYNFGFHAYGPNHMLAALQHGLVAETIDCNPTHVIYLGIPDHVARVAGVGLWDHYGPHYVADGKQLTFTGLRDSDPNPSVLIREVRWQLRKSKIASIWLNYKRPADITDIDLYVTVVEQARDHVQSAYREAEFHVLFWDWSDDEIAVKVRERLLSDGHDPHLVTDIIKTYQGSPSELVIPHDGHPSAAMHAHLADYVVENILDR